MNAFDEFREEVRIKISRHSGIKKQDVRLETPPKPEFGDLSFPCFTLCKKHGKKPAEIAEDLLPAIKKSGLVLRAERKGGYLNFFADWDRIGQKVAEECIGKGSDFGREKRRKENVMVEYCHFNTHKAVHIGHIRTACLGESLSRILDFSGCNVIRANYQGDIGPHVARCLWGFLKIHDGKAPRKGTGKWLGKVYAEASRKIKEDEKHSEEVEEINRKIYAGEPEMVRVWKKTRKWSLDYFDKIYRKFGIEFDRLYFESEAEKAGTEISKNLLSKGVAKRSEGAVMLDLDKYGLGTFLLLKSDGTPLYSAKDLGLERLKTKEYKIDKSIHVVGSEQRMYFQQLFKAFELADMPLAGKSHHLSYELVNLPSGKMASREGDVILYEDVLAELEKRAYQETKKRQRGMRKEEIEDISRKIALASLKYDMIKISPEKTIIFDWERALDFEDNAAPYILYTYARARSIVGKAGGEPKKFDMSLLKEPHERAIIRMISEFEGTVRKSAKDMRPHYLSNFCFDLCAKFNEFYHLFPVLKAGEGLKKARLALVLSVSITLRNGLDLLGIETLDKM